MAQNDLIKRFLDAGIQATQMSQQRAEALVKDLVKEGDVRKREAEALVHDLVERGRESTERLRALIQSEVSKQMARVNEQVDSLEARFAVLTGVGKPASTPLNPAA